MKKGIVNSMVWVFMVVLSVTLLVSCGDSLEDDLSGDLSEQLLLETGDASHGDMYNRPRRLRGRQ